MGKQNVQAEEVHFGNQNKYMANSIMGPQRNSSKF